MSSFTDYCVYFVVFQILWIVLPWLWSHILAPLLASTPDLRRYGEWAVVTGATDGIGKEFVKHLAAMKINVVLISRTKKKLQTVAAEIESQFGVKTRVIAVDFKDGVEIYDKIEEQIRGLDVGVLINNVGMMYPGPYPFHELAKRDSFMWDMIACNAISVPFMTKLVIDRMLQKKRGLVLNISSMAAYLPTPICLYSATKAYVQKFTEDLALEYEGRGIDIQTLNPGPVATNMWTVEGDRFTKPSAEVYVNAAMRSIGIKNAIGYYPHVFIHLFSQIIYILVPFVYKKIVVYSFKRAKTQ